MTVADGAGRGNEETSPLFENGGAKRPRDGGGGGGGPHDAPATAAAAAAAAGRRKSSKSMRPQHEISLTVREEGGWHGLLKIFFGGIIYLGNFKKSKTTVAGLNTVLK